MKTTKEQADENIHNNIVENLQTLLKENYDAEKIYKQSIESTENIQLKRFLQNQALQRNRFANELTQEIIALNEKPEDSGTFAGDLRRAWAGLKNALTADNEEVILNEAINGEKSSAEEYENVLRNTNFPPRIRQLIQRQAGEINHTLTEVKTFKDIIKDM